MRVVGAAAIALAASLVIENVVVLAGAPSYGAPIQEVLAYHAEHRGSVAIAVGLQALYLPLLLGFLTGLHGLVGRRGGTGARNFMKASKLSMPRRPVRRSRTSSRPRFGLQRRMDSSLMPRATSSGKRSLVMPISFR